MMTAYSTTAKRLTTTIPASTTTLAIAPRMRAATRGLKVSTRSQLPPFLALDILRTASELQATGQDVVHLEIGQPSTAAPQQVNDALVASLSATATHGYTLAFGVPALRQRIARHYNEWYGATPDTDRIAVTVGSSTAFAIAFMAAFDEGDRIAVPTPGYPAYRNLMMGLGLTPVPVRAGAEQNWKLNLAEMDSWDELPDGLMIASPSNPTGVVMGESELVEICRWCDARGVRLISDEIYHGLTFGVRCDSALNYTKNAIIVNSLSKYFSMTGWRIGWMVLPEDLISPSEKIAQNLFISAPTPNQIAAVSAFDCEAELDGHVSRYAVNRDILLSGLKPEFIGNSAPCRGAFYLYVNISALSENSAEFARQLLVSEGVATTPGLDFDPDNGHRYLRLSFAGSEQDMHEAVVRINRFIAHR
jgi:aspartate/methionine/tyrosine aminotransferase